MFYPYVERYDFYTLMNILTAVVASRLIGQNDTVLSAEQWWLKIFLFFSSFSGFQWFGTIFIGQISF